jgi:hypothetical protein
MLLPTDHQFSPSILSARYATLGTNGGCVCSGARCLDFFKAVFALILHAAHRPVPAPLCASPVLLLPM